MAIAAYAVGASKGFHLCSCGIPLAVSRLTIALREARRHGLLGNKHLQYSFNFEVEYALAPVRLVCGEETALIASMKASAARPSRAAYPPPAACGQADAD